MESSPEQAAEEYRLTLAELRTNNKTQINLLTILADDYRQFSEKIVDTIEAHLQTVPPPQKLTVLYVCDSIMKNVKKPNDYDVLFSRKIVGMFEHVFRQGDEKVRAALYKLRVTWGSTQVFIPSRLYQLDMKINQLDVAWPISNPRTGKSLRNDPQVAPPPENATSSSSAPPSTAPRGTASPRIFVNPRFIEGKPSAAPAPPSSSTKKTEKTKPVKTEPKEPREQKTVKKEPKIDPLHFSDKLLPTAASNAPKSSPSASKRKATPTEHTAAPSRKSTKSLDEDLRQMNVKKNQKDHDFRAPPRPLKPTSVVGSHAFAAPVRAQAPPPFVGGASGWTVPPSAAQHYNSPPQDPAPPMRAQAPPIQNVPAAPPAAAPVKNVYASEQTKLDVPANNRIFVDGKAYEVMFVDDTAVIERAGAPHRIYFAGPPRNLIIDGVPHLVPFDTPTPVDILGAQHTVKFGAPSRELYIGGHPFKGQFGGPPIVATINGRRHEIRLTGSAPEVKIEPEPAYHLTRFLHKMREEKKIETTAENKQDWLSYLKNLQKSGILPPVKSSTPPPPSQNPHAKRGRGGPRQPPPPPPKGQWSQQPTMMDPVPLPTGVEKRGAPPANLSEFNIRLLQIRYDSVVESLIKKRDDACRFCGMRIGDQRSEFAMAHLDMHVRQNLTNQASQTTTYRLWYPLESDWLTDRASDQPSDKKDAVEGAPLPGVASSGVKAKECAVCQETFDEYYDDDEETWRLRDTVSVHGKIVHAACSEDAALETPNSSMADNPFFVEVKEEEVEEDVKDFKHTVNFGQPLSSA